MTKRNRERRPNVSQETLERARAEIRGGVESVKSTPVPTGGVVAAARAKAATGRITTSARRIPTIEELRQEYSYVIKDLRNLVVLAGVLLVVIIAVAIILPVVGV
jgi:hypothetical protein